MTKNQTVGGIFEQMRASRMNEEAEDKNVGAAVPDEEPLDEENTGDKGAEDEGEDTSEEDLDEGVKKVVRDGEVVTKKVGRKKRLTTAQKAALAKARKKAHTAGAEKQRAKSNKIGRSRGLHEEETIECPECGFEGTEDDFDEEDGVLICPECGAEIETDESCSDKKPKKGRKKNEEVDVAELAARLDAVDGSEYMKDALHEGKYDLVQKYLDIKEGE